MILIINGENREVQEGLTLPNLLTELGLAGKPVVIEHNKEALAPSGFTSCQLTNGDQLEIITIAAGG